MALFSRVINDCAERPRRYFWDLNAIPLIVFWHFSYHVYVQAKLVKALVAAVEDQDVEAFTNTVADYDSISRSFIYHCVKC